MDKSKNDPSMSSGRARCRFRTLVVSLTLMLLCCATLSASQQFRQLCADLVEKSGGVGAIEGDDGWWFLKEEIIHLAAGKFWGEDAATASRTKNKKYADPVPTIVSYSTKLAEKGIKLYVMPVPPKALVYPEKLQPGISSDAAVEERAMYGQFFELLNKSGVEVIDLLPTLLKNKDKLPVYCKTDTHFSGEGLVYFAKAAAENIQNEPWFKNVAKQEYSLQTQDVAIKGDLLQMAGGAEAPETVSLTIVRNTDTGELVESDRQSPVVLLGDSHTLVFSVGGDLHAKGAGLFDHLSSELGFAVDLLGVRGSGVTPARIKFYQRSKKESTYLEGKKALIWCFAARDFTGSGGWKNIPVAPK